MICMSGDEKTGKMTEALITRRISSCGFVEETVKFPKPLTIEEAYKFLKERALINNNSDLFWIN